MTAFVTLDDRKNVSGSEPGNIIVWEGNMIRAMIFREKDVPCHDG